MHKSVRIAENIKNYDLNNLETASDYFEALRLCYEDDKDYAVSNAKTLFNQINRTIRAFTAARELKECGKWYELKRKVCLLLAPDSFDHYLQYVEWNREPSKKFYLPRRRVLLPLVHDLQDLADGNIDFLGISMPPRVGKSTLCIFFMTWIMGKHPDDASVMSGHSDKLTKGFYKELLTILTDTETYAWSDVFPNVYVVDKSAENETIDLLSCKRFSTMTCRSIEGALTGSVEIGSNGILYVDDLVKDLEEALSPDRLQKKYDDYLNMLKDRKKDGARELMVGTRWNVLDPLGRKYEQYKDNPRYRFTVIPALDDNDESNFNYDYGVGFSTEYYLDMKNSIDDASWCAKYMGNPYIREGLLFAPDALNYYNGELPDCKPDRIIAACDVAWGGGDYLSMPILYIYGADIYCHDVAFSNGNKEITYPLVFGKLLNHLPAQVQFEANNGGSEYADKINDLLKSKNIHLNVSSRKAPTNTSKIARIIKVAPEISKIHFRNYKNSTPEYREFMRWLTMFVITGKNTHDDAPDSLAMAIELITSNYGVVTIRDRPF